MRPSNELGVLRARAVLERVTALQHDRLELPAVREILVPGPAGALPARVYDPDPDRELPLVVYLHGGGWVMGSVRAADRPCRRLAVAGDCLVVSLEYRLAPETRFPGPLEDCLAAIRFLAATPAIVGAADGPLTLVGDSAGGNLAAAAALELRGDPDVALERQILIYPCLWPAARSPFASMAELAQAPLMTRDELEWFWGLYLRDEADERDPRAVPPLAADLAGVAPATIVVAELDPLRDEVLDYARRLAAAGVAVRSTVYEGAVHGFWWMDAALEQAGELTEQLGRILRDR